MLFPAFINCPLEPNNGTDGCVEFFEFILPKVADASSLQPPFPCVFEYCHSLHPRVFSPLFTSTRTHPSVFAVPTTRRRSTSHVIYPVSLVIFVYLFMI